MTENTGRLAGKVEIVTGGNSGMGASTVELFVKESARVMIAARGEEAGQTLATNESGQPTYLEFIYSQYPVYDRWVTSSHGH